MLGYILTAVAVIVIAAVAVVFTANWQDKRLRRRLRLEITNLGNVRSRYELKAEDPDGILKFDFTLDGDPLPQRLGSGGGEAVVADREQPVPSSQPAPGTGQPAPGAGVGQKVEQAVGCGTTIGSALYSLGMLLPSSIGRPLLQVASQISGGQIKVAQARQVRGQVSRVKSVAPRKKAEAKAVAPPKTAEGQAVPEVKAVQTILYSGVETPSVRPGETLVVDLLISAAKAGKALYYPFSVSSRTVEQEDVSWVIEEGNVRIVAAVGLRRYLPYMLVFAITAAILALIVWLASVGGLG